MEEEHLVSLVFDERAVRALSCAVDYTLEKWAGEGFIDQDELLTLKPFLHGTILEFQFHKPSSKK